MRNIPSCAVAMLIACGVTLAPGAFATTMRHLDTRDLALGSSDIVVGAVEAVRPRWSTDHAKIFTDVDLRVARSLKGGATQRITLTQLGGELDGIKYSIAGGPLFRTGQEVVVFVWRDAKGRAQVNGLAQGKFDITRDAQTGVATVQRSAPGFGIKDAQKLGALAANEVAPRIMLDDLEREIRSALAHPGAGR